MSEVLKDIQGPFKFSDLFTRTKEKAGNHSNQNHTVNSFPCEIGLGFPHLKTLKSRDNLKCKPQLLELLEPLTWLYPLNTYNYHFYTKDGYLFLKASRICSRGKKVCKISF